VPREHDPSPVRRELRPDEVAAEATEREHDPLESPHEIVDDDLAPLDLVVVGRRRPLLDRPRRADVRHAAAVRGERGPACVGALA
jgi:hypothetical protein